MSKIDEVKEFSNMTKKIFEDFVEIGSKKLKNLYLGISGDDFSVDKKYSENNQSEDKNTAKYVDKYYDLKEDVSAQGQGTSTAKNNEKIQRVPLDLDFSEENIMQAVVYSEIFGKPKAKRRRR